MKKPRSDDFLPLIHVYLSRVDRNRLKAISGVDPSEVLKRLASQLMPVALNAASELFLKGHTSVRIGDEKIEFSTR